jgi:antagonist of KipI
MSVVKIISPGLLTTVQDDGRYAYQRFGMSISGAMDRFSSHVANFLVGNDPGEAVLETTLMGPSLEMQGDCVIALTGADMAPQIDGKAVPMWQTLFVPKGSMLTFSALTCGARGYIAFAGGIDLPEVMGSRSTYVKAKVGGLEGRPLRAGDVLSVNRLKKSLNIKRVRVAEQYIPNYPTEQVLRVVLGPQDDYFTQEGIDTLVSETYTVSKECDRMGYRLEGKPIAHKESADIISDGIMIGSVQVPGNGLPIILMADRQTTGGYTKVATVISVDLPKVAQAKAGDSFRFEIVSVEQAQQILFEEAQRMKALQASCIEMMEAPAPQAATPPAPPPPAPPQPAPSPAAGSVSSGVIHQSITINGVTYQVELREIL